MVKCFYCRRKIEEGDIKWHKVRVAISKNPLGETYHVKVPFHYKCYRKFKFRQFLCYLSSMIIFVILFLLLSLPLRKYATAMDSYSLIGDLLFSLVMSFVFYEVLLKLILYPRTVRILKIEKHYKKYIK